MPSKKRSLPAAKTRGRHDGGTCIKRAQKSKWWKAGSLSGIRPRRHTPKSSDFDESALEECERVCELFLGSDLLFTSAYFTELACTFQHAQRARLDLICRKLHLQPHDRFWMWPLDAVGLSPTPRSTFMFMPQAARRVCGGTTKGQKG